MRHSGAGRKGTVRIDPGSPDHESPRSALVHEHEATAASRFANASSMQAQLLDATTGSNAFQAHLQSM